MLFCVQLNKKNGRELPFEKLPHRFREALLSVVFTKCLFIVMRKTLQIYKIVSKQKK